MNAAAVTDRPWNPLAKLGAAALVFAAGFGAGAYYVWKHAPPDTAPAPQAAACESPLTLARILMAANDGSEADTSPYEVCMVFDGGWSGRHACEALKVSVKP